jgi:hypothetical protein
MEGKMKRLLSACALVAALAVLGCSSDDGDDGTGPELGTAIMEIVSGDNQTGDINTALEPFVVRVRTTTGILIEGVFIDWTRTSGPQGTISPSETRTDADGEASTTLTLGGVAGTVTVSAMAPGWIRNSTITFTATGETP